MTTRSNARTTSGSARARHDEARTIAAPVEAAPAATLLVWHRLLESSQATHRLHLDAARGLTEATQAAASSARGIATWQDVLSLQQAWWQAAMDATRDDYEGCLHESVVLQRDVLALMRGAPVFPVPAPSAAGTGGSATAAAGIDPAALSAQAQTAYAQWMARWTSLLHGEPAGTS